MNRRHGAAIGAGLLVAIVTTPASAREPTIAEVQAAAVRAAGLSPDRALDAAGRARAAALLPALRVRIARDLDRDESLDLEAGRADQLGLGASERLVLEVRAEWDLARLAFEPGELAALETAARISRERRELLEVVTRLYFERRRVAPSDRARFAEVTALLDAMTAGLYTRAEDAGMTSTASPGEDSGVWGQERGLPRGRGPRRTKSGGVGGAAN